MVHRFLQRPNDSIIAGKEGGGGDVLRLQSNQELSCLVAAGGGIGGTNASGSALGGVFGNNAGTTASVGIGGVANGGDFGGVAGGVAGTTATAGTSASSAANGGSVTSGAGGTSVGGSTSTTRPGPWASETADGTWPMTHDQYVRATTQMGLYCNGTSVDAGLAPMVIEFLVDVSGSMLRATVATNGQSKWEVTRAALKSAVQNLSPSSGVGVAFFPNMPVTEGTDPRPVSACIDSSHDVPIGLASSNQNQLIRNALDSLTITITGSAATHDAYDIALQNLRNSDLAGRKYVVLISDGQPTVAKGCIGNGSECYPQPAAPIVAQMADASSNYGISTCVIGLPGSEASACTGEELRDWMSAAATAGNTAAPGCSDTGPRFCHIDLSASADLSIALTDALLNITKPRTGGLDRRRSWPLAGYRIRFKLETCNVRQHCVG